MTQLLQRPEYLHAMLCHFPLIGLGVALGVLCIGLLFEHRALTLTGLVLVGVLSALIWPVVASGEAAYQHLKDQVDGETSALLEAHLTAAETWSALFYLTAVAAWGAVLVTWKWPRRMWLPAAITACCAVLCLVVGVGIAHSGGQVRHPEFRPAPSPPHEALALPLAPEGRDAGTNA